MKNKVKQNKWLDQVDSNKILQNLLQQKVIIGLLKKKLSYKKTNQEEQTTDP